MSNSNKNNAGGRKKGIGNKYTTETRKILLDILGSEYLKKIDKLINDVSFDKRLTALKPFAKILCSENDEVGKQTREMIFEGLKEHFTRNRFRSYFNLLDDNKKITEMRQWEQMLTKEQIEELTKGLIKKI